MSVYFPKQTTGYTVVTKLASGHESSVYWAADFKEALTYAEFIVEHFAHQMTVRVVNNETGHAAASWAGVMLSNASGMPLAHWACA